MPKLSTRDRDTYIWTWSRKTPDVWETQWSIKSFWVISFQNRIESKRFIKIMSFMFINKNYIWFSETIWGLSFIKIFQEFTFISIFNFIQITVSLISSCLPMRTQVLIDISVLCEVHFGFLKKFMTSQHGFVD